MDAHFEVREIGYMDADSSYVISFSAKQDIECSPETLLLLSRSTDSSDDVKGIEGVYIEWCDQINSCYGCIKHFIIGRERIIIQLSWQILTLPATITMLLYISDDEYSNLLNYLEGRIFIGCDEFEQTRYLNSSNDDAETD